MVQETESKNAKKEPAGDACQFLTFSLAREEYGVDILRVQEIRGWEPVTRVPNQPPYVKGVLNLRGAIVPVFDLRSRFGMAPCAYSKDTVVIVLRVSGRTGMRSMGVVVDAVSDVLDARTTDVRTTPEFGVRVSTELIRGIVSLGSKMVMLLDVDRLLGDDAPGEGQEADQAA